MKVNINLLLCIDEFIRQKSTGEPEKFAEKLEISVATLYRYLDVMKKYGAPVGFSRSDRTYYYKTAGSITIGFIKSSDMNRMPHLKNTETV